MKIHRYIEEEIEAHPGRCELRNGGKHIHVIVDGKLACILPKGSGIESNARAALNARSYLRRALRRHA